MQLQSLSRSITGLCRRPRRWTPALARRDSSPTLSAASAHPNRQPGRLPRFLCTTCCDKEMGNKPTKEVTGNNNPAKAVPDIYFASILPNSSHRDGAIYKNKHFWFDADITDRNETRLEPMRFSKPTQNFNFPRNMLQFFSLTLAECSLSNDSIQLYGYIAARDDNDQMLNYVLNHSRDDPVIAHKGSLIQMTGPKRGIELVSPVLIEFDIRIKNGEREEDDGQLVDGAITCNDRRAWKPVKRRIKGNCGAVDISMACVENALEATIEVVISEVRSGFSLSMQSFVCVLEDEYEEIQLFHGAIDRPCRLGRFVLAVTWGDVMVLKFKLGGDDGVERRRSFKAQVLGCSSRWIKHELANILVKVTWSTI